MYRRGDGYNLGGVFTHVNHTPALTGTVLVSAFYGYTPSIKLTVCISAVYSWS